MLYIRTFLFSLFIYNNLYSGIQNTTNFGYQNWIYVLFLHEMSSVIESKCLSKDFFPFPDAHHTCPSVMIAHTEKGMERRIWMTWKFEGNPSMSPIFFQNGSCKAHRLSVSFTWFIYMPEQTADTGNPGKAWKNIEIKRSIQSWRNQQDRLSIDSESM